MVIRLFSGFSTNDTGFFAGEAQAVSGSSVVTWRSTGQFFIPFGVTGFASGTFQYSGAVQQLTDDLNALSLTFPPTIFEVRYDNAINRIVISSSNAPYRIEFNASLQRTFGLDQEYFSPQSKVITGSVAPYFVWTSTQDSRANDTFPYEQTPYVTERLSDSGIAYSIGRRTVEKRRDWEFILEPKSNVFATFSSSLEPFNWERFIKNLRERPNPFVLMEDVTGSTVFYDDREAFYEMRAEAMNFKPRSAADIDYHEFWSVPVRTRVHFPRHRDRKEIESGLPCPVPTAPAVIYPSDMAVSVSLLPGLTQVLLSWSQPSPVTNYNVYFGTDPTPDIGEFVATTTNNFFTASATGSNEVYYWKVDSTNDCGVRTNDVWSFKTDTVIPAFPLSGVLARYNASYGVTTGSGVVSWLDATGHGFHLTTSLAAAPTFNASRQQYNLSSSITFESTMAMSSVIDITPTAGALGPQDGMTLIQFMTPISTSVSGVIVNTVLDGGFIPPSVRPSLALSTFDPQYVFLVNTPLASAVVSSSNITDFTSSSAVVATEIKVPYSSSIWVNGVLEGSIDFNYGVEREFEGAFSINREDTSFTATPAGNFEVAEIILLNRSLNPGDIDIIETYHSQVYPFNA